MYEYKHRMDIIGNGKLIKINERLEDIMSNCREAEYCFKALTESYFDIAEYTGLAISFYCKMGYPSLADGRNSYGYNDICKFDDYARACFESTEKIREIIEIRFGELINTPEINDLFDKMRQRVFKNEFSIPKDYFLRECKETLLIKTVSTYIKICTAQEFDPNYKYDDEDTYNLLMDTFEEYGKEKKEFVFKEENKSQLVPEIAALLRQINNKSIFRGKVFEKHNNLK